MLLNDSGEREPTVMILLYIYSHVHRFTSKGYNCCSKSADVTIVYFTNGYRRWIKLQCNNKLQEIASRDTYRVYILYHTILKLCFRIINNRNAYTREIKRKERQSETWTFGTPARRRVLCPPIGSAGCNNLTFIEIDLPASIHGRNNDFRVISLYKRDNTSNAFVFT